MAMVVCVCAVMSQFRLEVLPYDYYQLIPTSVCLLGYPFTVTHTNTCHL